MAAVRLFSFAHYLEGLRGGDGGEERASGPHRVDAGKAPNRTPKDDLAVYRCAGWLAKLFMNSSIRFLVSSGVRSSFRVATVHV